MHARTHEALKIPVFSDVHQIADGYMTLFVSFPEHPICYPEIRQTRLHVVSCQNHLIEICDLGEKCKLKSLKGLGFPASAHNISVINRHSNTIQHVFQMPDFFLSMRVCMLRGFIRGFWSFSVFLLESLQAYLEVLQDVCRHPLEQRRRKWDHLRLMEITSQSWALIVPKFAILMNQM